jgi:membrane protein
LRIFSERGARLLCGSVAFYALLSIVPILVIAVRMASWFVDAKDVGSALGHELEYWVGVRGSQTLLALVFGAPAAGGSSLTSALGLLALWYAATRLFSLLIKALDLLWAKEPEITHRMPRLMRQLRRRGLAFGMVLVVGLMLLGLVLFHVGLGWARHQLALEPFVSRPVEAFVSFSVATLLFSLMFRVLPSASVRTSDALTGGVVTASLFTLGSVLITAYITHRDVSVYGAAGALVTLMLWAHYSAHAFFLGAAFTAAHAGRRERLAIGAESAKLAGGEGPSSRS